MIFDHYWSFYEILHIWSLLPILRIWVEYWDVMFNFTYLSWGWVITIIFELRVSHHHHFEDSMIHEMSYSSWVEYDEYFELWVILMNCFDYLKFFLIYVLWDFRVIPWDSDLTPRVSLDGTREGILRKVYWCSLTRYAKPRGPCWSL